MKKKLLICQLIISSILLWGCNNTLYEIEEVEEVVDIKPEVKPSTITPDIKEEVKPQVETKTEDREIVSKTYIIQIGAFTSEENAAKFTNNAKNQLSDNSIYYKNISGLYKVRFGTYNTKEEAILNLDKIKNAGFNDSFVVELTYVKTEK